VSSAALRLRLVSPPQQRGRGLRKEAIFSQGVESESSEIALLKTFSTPCYGKLAEEGDVN
jgi:hypothetical protein